MTLHKTNKSECGRVRQGDVFPNVPYYESYREIDGEFELTMFEFPYVVVLTQDCDLEQNKDERDRCQNVQDNSKQDKHLISVIVAPLYNAEHIFSGTHLSEIGISSQQFSSKPKGLVQTNQNARYHYIEFENSVLVPNSVVDFKHYFSVSLKWLEGGLNRRLCGLEPLYREHLSQRYSNYLSRIGLPDHENKMGVVSA